MSSETPASATLDRPRPRLYHGYLVVLACCAMSLTTAVTWNTAGVFMPFVVKDLGVLRGALALYLTITSFTSSLFLPIAGRLMQVANARYVLTAAALLNAGAVMTMSLVQSLWQFYGLAVALGIAQAFFLYLATPTLIGRWFKVRTGTLIGIAMSFTAIGAVVLNPVAGWVISTAGWRQGYLTLGIILLVVVVPPVALFVRTRPEDMGLTARGDTGLQDGANNAAEPMGPGATVSAATKSRPFYILITGLFALSLFNDFNAYLPSFATSLGYGVAIVSTVGSASMLGATVGKFGLGALNDFSIRSAVLTCGLSGATGAALMLIFGGTNTILLFVGAFLYGIMYSAATVQAPLLVREAFGDREFSQIHSIVMMVYSLASAVGQSLWGFMADAQGGSYTAPLYAILGLALVFLTATLMARAVRHQVVWTYPEQTTKPASGVGR